ncbi:MAG TPA: 3-deoxy-7-phosphoheptulonate synthase, partial [Clostridia bacterium]|nr:3-deoxy-7-phosphoheptulonate synthase [Clostridia bacterium]
MIVVMAHNASPEEIRAVTDKLSQAGFQLHLSQGVSRTIIGVI